MGERLFQGARDLLIFLGIAYLVGVLIGYELIGGSSPEFPYTLYIMVFVTTLYIMVFVTAFQGLFAIPGLWAHRLLVRDAERSGTASRVGVIARALVIPVASPWWLFVLDITDPIEQLAKLGLLWVIAAVLYGAVVPMRAPV
ncbi:MAG: hypothetical protein LC722_05865 [Actinobacteria bacterium]|nr:hypothetical protein [Actinomycetota bacterium]